MCRARIVSAAAFATRVWTLRLLVALAFGTGLVASDTDATATNAGTDFLLTYLPAIHQNGDSLSLVFSSQYYASGTIDVRGYDGKVIHQTFRIIDPRRSSTVSFPYSNIELRGRLVDSVYQASDQAETILSSQVLAIHADSAVQCVMVTHSKNGDAATLVLPTSILGRSYILSSLPSTLVHPQSGSSDVDWTKSTPSQCAVIARDDATDIVIQLHGPTSHESEGKISISLNKGEAYFIQSAIEGTSVRTDMSGVIIKATKPIAVFSGHQSAVSPGADNGIYPNTQTGTVYQQCDPVERWGDKAVLVPLKVSENARSTTKQYVRIYAALDQTHLKINGVEKAVLDAGVPFELGLDDAVVVEGSSAINCVQYTQSSTDVQTSLGNTAMFTVPSTSSWTNSHVVCAPQIRSSGIRVYGSQYLLVCLPTNAKKSLEFDREPIETGFVEVSGSDYSYYLRKVSDGIHSLTCDSACSATVFSLSTDRMIVHSPDQEYPIRAYMKPYLRVPDCSARVGDTVLVRVLIDSLLMPPAILGLQPSSFSFDLCFNSTMLTPAESSLRGPILNGVQTIHVSDTLTTLRSARELLSIKMICGLGDAEHCDLQVSNLSWYNSDKSQIPLAINDIRGQFSVSNVWHDTTGARLVNPNPGDLSIEVTPNPVHGRAFINCSSTLRVNDAPTMILYNSMGEQIQDLNSSVTPFKGSARFQLNTDTMQPGVYYLRFAIGNTSMVTPVVVEN